MIFIGCLIGTLYFIKCLWGYISLGAYRVILHRVPIELHFIWCLYSYMSYGACIVILLRVQIKWYNRHHYLNVLTVVAEGRRPPEALGCGMSQPDRSWPHEGQLQRASSHYTRTARWCQQTLEHLTRWHHRQKGMRLLVINGILTEENRHWYEIHICFTLYTEVWSAEWLLFRANILLNCNIQHPWLQNQNELITIIVINDFYVADDFTNQIVLRFLHILVGWSRSLSDWRLKLSFCHRVL